MVACSVMRGCVCVRVEESTHTLCSSAWEGGRPAAVTPPRAQTLAPALRRGLLGGMAGSRPGTGSVHDGPAVRKGSPRRTPRASARGSGPAPVARLGPPEPRTPGL